MATFYYTFDDNDFYDAFTGTDHGGTYHFQAEFPTEEEAIKAQEVLTKILWTKQIGKEIHLINVDVSEMDIIEKYLNEAGFFTAWD